MKNTETIFHIRFLLTCYYNYSLDQDNLLRENATIISAFLIVVDISDHSRHSHHEKLIKRKQITGELWKMGKLN